MAFTGVAMDAYNASKSVAKGKMAFYKKLTKI